jgi:hypothetical protein
MIVSIAKIRLKPASRRESSVTGEKKRCWMLDIGLTLNYHPVSRIKYPASSTPLLSSLDENLTHLLRFWPFKKKRFVDIGSFSYQIVSGRVNYNFGIFRR